VPQGAFFAAKTLRVIDLNQIATTDRRCRLSISRMSRAARRRS